MISQRSEELQLTLLFSLKSKRRRTGCCEASAAPHCWGAFKSGRAVAQRRSWASPWEIGTASSKFQRARQAGHPAPSVVNAKGQVHDMRPNEIDDGIKRERLALLEMLEEEAQRVEDEERVKGALRKRGSTSSNLRTERFGLLFSLSKRLFHGALIFSTVYFAY